MSDFIVSSGSILSYYPLSKKKKKARLWSSVAVAERHKGELEHCQINSNTYWKAEVKNGQIGSRANNADKVERQSTKSFPKKSSEKAPCLLWKDLSLKKKQDWGMKGLVKLNQTACIQSIIKTI